MAASITGVGVGCAASADHAKLSVSETSSGMDAALVIKASGLSPGERVTISATSTDAAKVAWQAAASYEAGSDGTIDTRTAASRSGSYTGVDQMGLITFMRPVRSETAKAVYRWAAGDAHFTFTLRVDDKTVSSATVTRTAISPATTSSELTVQDDGFAGDYRSPTSTSESTPAVLIIGGSEGGNSATLLGARLAAHGIRALSVAYFGENGLPDSLSAIPLEYFRTALTWLRRQPGVDPARVWIIGGSRGTEAAQLLAVHYPGVIHGIVLNAPSSVALCSYPGCDGPAWTYHGHPVPYTKQVNTTTPDNSAAVIGVQKINGPVLAVCGSQDTTWISCEYAKSIMSRLSDNSFAHTLLQYPDAGHLGAVLAFQPGSATLATTGGTALGTDRARAQAWPREVGFILHNSR